MNYMQNYNTVKKSDTGFDNTLKEQVKDEVEELLASKNSCMANEDFWKLIKGGFYELKDGRIVSDAEANKTGANEYVRTGEVVKRDQEFLMSGPNTFNPAWFDKDGNLINGIAFKNKKANAYENLYLSGCNSKVDLGNGYSIQIHDDRLLYCYRDVTMTLEDKTAGGKHYSYLVEEVGMEFAHFLGLLRHHADGNISSMWLNSARFSGSRKHFLENMGINTTKPFTINCQEFKQ